MLKFGESSLSYGKTIAVAVVIALFSAMAATSALAEELPPGSLDIDTAVASVPGLGILLDATEATIADGVDIHAPGSNAVVYVSDNGGVEIPDDPTIGVTLTGPDGASINIGVPGNPDDAAVSSNGTVTYGNAYRDTSVIVQPQIGGGARMITILGSIHERTNYDFVVTLAAEQEINLSEGGGVSITDSMGEVDMAIPPPWAYDASGSVVASDYSLEGTTLTLNIHPGSSAVYPIIADPVFTWGWVTGTVYFNKLETRMICTNTAQSLAWLGITGFWYPILVALGWYLTIYSCIAGITDRCIKVKSYGSVFIYAGTHCN